MYAIHSHSIENVRLVIEKFGADLNFIYNNGFTSLHYSILENNIEISEYLLTKSMSQNNYIDFSSLLRIALNESSTFMIHLLLDFHIKNYDNFINSSRKFERFYLNKNTCSNICKCLIFGREISTDVKLKVYKIIFEDLNFQLTKLEETLYLILTDSVNHKIVFQYLFNLLQRQLENKKQSQEILYEIIIKHLNNVTNSSWVEKIELLFNHVDEKKSLYDQIIKSNSIDVNETTLHSCKIDIDTNIKGYCFKIKHPYFIKQQVLVKFDIMPKDVRLYWLNYFISQWIDLCSLNRSYISASSTSRYLTADELINLTLDYYEHLVKYDYANSTCDLTYTLENIRLIDTRKFDAINNSRSNESIKKNFLNLKLICRNKIRQSLSSITDHKLKSLELPDFLVEIVKGEQLIS
jgi:hypothetical protein